MGLFLVGNSALRKRLPKVSYRTEIPFIIGGMITFGLVTWIHHSNYSKNADPFIAPPKKQEEAPAASSDSLEFKEDYE